MPDRDGRHDSPLGGLIALLGVIGVALIFLAYTGDITARREVAGNPANYHCKTSDQCATQGVQASVQAALAAQDSVDVAVWQLLLNVLGIGGLAFTIYYARKAWIEGQRSADAAHLTLEEARKDGIEQAERFQQQLKVASDANDILQASLAAEHRPWVKITTIDKPNLIWKDGGVSLAATYNLQNTGRTPAEGVNIDVRLHAQLANGPEIIQAEMLARTGRRQFGDLIFPNDPFQQEITVSLTPEEISAEIDYHQSLGARASFFMMYLIVVVSYWGAAPDEHRTAFIFSLSPNGDGPMKAMPVGADVGPDMLRLYRYWGRTPIAT